MEENGTHITHLFITIEKVEYHWKSLLILRKLLTYGNPIDNIRLVISRGRRTAELISYYESCIAIIFREHERSAPCIKHVILELQGDALSNDSANQLTSEYIAYKHQCAFTFSSGLLLHIYNTPSAHDVLASPWYDIDDQSFFDMQYKRRAMFDPEYDLRYEWKFYLPDEIPELCDPKNADEFIHLFSRAINKHIPTRNNEQTLLLVRKLRFLLKSLLRFSASPESDRFEAQAAYDQHLSELHPGDVPFLTQDMATQQTIVRCLELAQGGLDPVLIIGPTGTGKELLAKLYETEYNSSHTTSGVYVTHNAATMRPELMQSTLFGHIKGAFTGATDTHEGLVSLANGNVLFLDEIDSLSLDSQAQLLRFIETREYRRVGETQKRNANVKLIFATNKDPNDLLESGRVRSDFYYRISTHTLRITALNERKGDIELILKSLCKVAISAEIMSYLMQRPWPGNVRELLAYTKSEHFAKIIQSGIVPPPLCQASCPLRKNGL